MIDSVSTAASRPVRLVAGRWRRLLSRWRTFLAACPVVWPFVAALILMARLSPWVGVVASTAYAALLSPWWSMWLARLYWRARWTWDARAAGLARFAEKGINLRFDRLSENTLEVAPALLRVRVDEHANRLYVIRPLPGSTADEFARAGELLRTRWRAADVSVMPDESGSRWARGRVVIEVVMGRTIDAPLTMPVDLIDV